MDRWLGLVKTPHVHRQPSGKVNNSARGQRWRRIISGQAVVVQCLAQHGLSLARVQRLARRICALKTAHRLRLCIACSKTFPGYLAAAFDIFCCISAHARRVALSVVRSTVGLGDCLCDCARLLELRGSAGFGAAFGGDVACGCCECLRRPAAYSVRSPEVFGDVDRS